MAGNKKKKKAVASSKTADKTDDDNQKPDSKASTIPKSSSEITKASSSSKSPEKPAKAAPAKASVVTDLAAAFAKQAIAPSLKISRNKHWRYVSEYSGPWLTFTVTVTKTLTWTNYTKTLPRYVDNGLCFDLLRVREMIDKAVHLSVGATNGVMPSGPGSAQTADGRGPQMSALRRHRLRVEAIHHLAEAYALDEIAASLLVMQNSSALDSLPGLVLERAPDNQNAHYVHFFHEKIPSQQLLRTTHPEMLDSVVEGNPRNPGVWRTRGVVRMMKDDFEGAVADLTESLRLLRINELAINNKRRIMAEEAAKEATKVDGGSATTHTDEAKHEMSDGTHPPNNTQGRLGMSSADMQVRFQRAQAYLAMACQCIYAALGPEWVKHGKRELRANQMAARDKAQEAKEREEAKTELVEKDDDMIDDNDENNDNDNDNDDDDDDDNQGGATLRGGEHLHEPESQAPNNDTHTIHDNEDDEQTKEQRKEQLRIKRQMRMYAKRAIRDILSFLSTLGYTPNIAIHTGEDFVRRVIQMAVSRGNGASSTWLLSHGMAMMKDFKAQREQQPHATLPDPPNVMDDDSAIDLPMSALLDGSPIPELPAYPREIKTKSTTSSTETETDAAEDKPNTLPMAEAATFHPLLSNALHSLLLCHCLTLTPPSELMRIMNVVARLTSLADGYPFFQHSPCTTKQDWIEILRLAGGSGWVHLPDRVSWDQYTAPTVPPPTSSGPGGSKDAIMPAPSGVSARAQAIAYWILENKRLNSGVIKERPVAEDGEDGTPHSATLRLSKGKKKVNKVASTAGP